MSDKRRNAQTKLKIYKFDTGCVETAKVRKCYGKGSFKNVED